MHVCETNSVCKFKAISKLDDVQIQTTQSQPLTRRSNPLAADDLSWHAADVYATFLRVPGSVAYGFFQPPVFRALSGLVAVWSRGLAASNDSGASSSSSTTAQEMDTGDEDDENDGPSRKRKHLSRK